MTYREMHIQELQAQVDSLQARGTELVNENRMLRAQLDAAKTILNHAHLELPIVVMTNADPEQYSKVNLKKLYERIELLEKDAWTQTTGAVREFLEEEKTIGHRSEFVVKWATKFKALVGT